MNALLFLIPVALGLGFLGLVAFLWSLRSDQYEDVQGAAYRILTDDDLRPEEQAKINAKPDDAAETEDNAPKRMG